MHMRVVENCAETQSEGKQDSVRLPFRLTPESVELQAGMHMRVVENCAGTQSEVKQDSVRLPFRLTLESVELQVGMHTRVVQKCAKTRSEAEGKIKGWRLNVAGGWNHDYFSTS